jgi:methyl-accepting chemotaxis protein
MFNALTNLSIKAKLYSGFGMILAMCVGLVVFGAMELGTIKTSVGSMQTRSLSALRSGELVENLEKMRRSALRYAYDRDEGSLKENGELAVQAIATIKVAEAATVVPARLAKYKSILEQVSAMQNSVGLLVETAKRADADKAKLVLAGDELTAVSGRLLLSLKGGTEAVEMLGLVLDADLQKLRVANWRAMATQDLSGLAALKTTAEKAGGTIAALEKGDLPQNARTAIAPLKASIASYAAISTDATETLVKVHDTYTKDISPKVRAIQATLGGMKTETVEGLKQAIVETDATIAETTLIQEIVAALAVLLGGIVAFFVARGVSNPIRLLTAGMRELANGNFGIVLFGLGRKDEIGGIAKAVEEFKVKAAERAQIEAEAKIVQDKEAAVARDAAMEKMANEFEAAVGSIVTAAVAGDFTQRVDLDGKTGLVLNIGTAINSLCDNTGKALDDLIGMLNALAEGDMTQRITAAYQGNFAVLKDNANKTAERIGSTLGEIKTAAREVTSASAEISTSTTDLSQRTEEQAASLEQTSASMEEISATVKQNAENAKQANSSAGSTEEVAERGGQVVAKAVEAMAKIEESSRKISDIIGVIDEIARQTNLLALNAAVEAARAGEAGRGFAVVASEVRSLAQRSAQAAKDIKDLISNSNGQVKDGVELVNRAGTALTEIVVSIKKVVVIVADIANASAEQASGIDQVNKALTQMDEVTQQNSALVEENAATAKTLETQAKALDERVAFFRLDAAEGNRAAAPAHAREPHRVVALPSRGPASKRPPAVLTPKRAVAAHSGSAGRTNAVAAAAKSDPDWKEF